MSLGGGEGIISFSPRNLEAVFPRLFPTQSYPLRWKKKHDLLYFLLLRIRIRDPVLFGLRMRDPDWQKVLIQDPESGNVPDLIFENKLSYFWVKNTKLFDGIRIRD